MLNACGILSAASVSKCIAEKGREQWYFTIGLVDKTLDNNKKLAEFFNEIETISFETFQQKKLKNSYTDHFELRITRIQFEKIKSTLSNLQKYGMRLSLEIYNKCWIHVAARHNTMT